MDFVIYDLLPVGRENAISTPELVRLSGCHSARELQGKIAEERAAGAVICSGGTPGYWRPGNRQEVEDFIRTMKGRALYTLAAIKSAKRLLDIPEGQHILLRETGENGET